MWTPKGDFQQTALARDLKNTLDDIFSGPRCTPITNWHSEFWLYINLYMHFFNIDPELSAYCNDISFSPWFVTEKRKVQLGTREAINDGVQKFNEIYVSKIMYREIYVLANMWIREQ